MADRAGDTVSTGNHLSIAHQRTTNAGADGNDQRRFLTLRGAEPCLGKADRLDVVERRLLERDDVIDAVLQVRFGVGRRTGGVDGVLQLTGGGAADAQVGELLMELLLRRLVDVERVDGAADGLLRLLADRVRVLVLGRELPERVAALGLEPHCRRRPCELVLIETPSAQITIEGRPLEHAPWSSDETVLGLDPMLLKQGNALYRVPQMMK